MPAQGSLSQRISLLSERRQAQKPTCRENAAPRAIRWPSSFRHLNRSRRIAVTWLSRALLCKKCPFLSEIRFRTIHGPAETKAREQISLQSRAPHQVVAGQGAQPAFAPKVAGGSLDNHNACNVQKWQILHKRARQAICIVCLRFLCGEASAKRFRMASRR